MAGGNFWTGAVGLTNGISSTGFLAGAASGASAGFAGGFVLGAGNSWIDGHCFGKGFLSGLGSGGIGALTGGVTGGLFGGLDALDKNTNFWTGNAHLDPNGAYSCAEMDPEGLLNKLKEKSEKIIGKYVGDYEDQHVFETPILGTYSDQGGYSGITFPDRGIFVGK